MVARALVFELLLLAACKESKSPPAPPAEPCFADDLGPLRPDWKVLDDCNEDRTKCRDECLEGDGDACFNLAIALQADSADQTDEIRAYFKRGCSAGLAMSCTNWAAGQWLVSHATSWHCAYRVFDMSCTAGESFGCSMTARMLMEEPRTPLDQWIAVSQLHNACERFDGPPCRFLALYIERGKFGSPDSARVKALLERACRGGDDESCGKTTAGQTMK